LQTLINNSANHYSMNIYNNIISKREPYIGDEINSNQDSCWHHILADGCFIANEYIKGLGGPYYICEGFNMERESRNLVYYKKGNTTWGTPLILTGIKSLESNSNIIVTFNSINNKITIENLIENAVFQLIDTKGAIKLKTKINVIQNSIQLNNLNKGLYLYRIFNSDKLLKSGKLIKQ